MTLVCAGSIGMSSARAKSATQERRRVDFKCRMGHLLFNMSNARGTRSRIFNRSTGVNCCAESARPAMRVRRAPPTALDATDDFSRAFCALFANHAKEEIATHAGESRRTAVEVEHILFGEFFI